MSTARDRNGRRRLLPLADAIACTAVTGVLLLVAFGGWTSEHALQHGQPADAQVTDVHSGRYPTYDVQFTTAAGTTITTQTSFALAGAHPGDTIQVLYDPAEPDTVGQVGSLGLAWLQWAGWLAAGVLGIGASVTSWKRVIRRRRAQVGRHTSPNPQVDRHQRRTNQKIINRRWWPLLRRIVLGLPVPRQDHTFAVTRARETVDRLPQSWLGYLILLVGASGALAGIFPLAQTPTWLRTVAAISIGIFLAGMIVSLRIQWWHRQNRPPSDNPD